MTRWLLIAVVMGSGGALGCLPDLPACDEDQAYAVAWTADGDPAYVGQALVRTSCGGGQYCHASDAEGADRYGAPSGFDFDVRPLSAGNDPEALRADRRRVHRHRRLIADVVGDGRMPPGGVGMEVVRRSPTYRPDPAPTSVDRLPSIDSREGRRALRNWLACGSPVVETSVPPGGPSAPGDLCGPGPHGIGDCVVAAPPAPRALPRPDWSSIYERLILPRCGACHGAEGPANSGFERGALDFSTETGGYDALVEVPAEGDPCGDGDAPLRVDLTDPEASLLLQKLRGTEGCGQSMPLGEGLLDAAVVDVVDSWIRIGAPREASPGGEPAEPADVPTAELIPRFHGVRGTARFVDDRTLVIDGFYYDGTGIDVRIYGGLQGDYANGFSMSDDLVREGGYENETLTLTLPAGRTITDLDGISVWCVAARVSFGDGMFE